MSSDMATPRERSEYASVLQSMEARQTLTALEWRIIKHLYAGMSDDWICDTLACRLHDITRAKHRARRWMTSFPAE
ncbi:hypothetical protein Sulac_1128 [Sulfobacillus acidophilus DSM 10332]|uniref:HTH luxR-type domain-containing protein n=1 Tax=Sulfobacillus acidophilus (strain ATCC 700253 / DSM 10332 / NAL) TaxID=679936 RepID=G8TUI1_SULAD|nr:hypothetical protein Sulac_1128 [Sulfobacillus acidophilus DSM 10332]